MHITLMEGLCCGIVQFSFGQVFSEEMAVPVLKPAKFVFDNLTITPSRVEVNRPVTVKVDVANMGGKEGARLISLVINAVVEENRTISLGGALHH